MNNTNKCDGSVTWADSASELQAHHAYSAEDSEAENASPAKTVTLVKIWRPFTQEKTSADSIKIVRGCGSYVFDAAGNKYLDLISSWWVNLHGHAHPKIAEAIYEQAKKLEHVIFAGFSHDPAESLCEKLSTVLSSKLCRFFFSDNGSTAVEIALKMSYQFWINKGVAGRKKFISFQGGYHGDTVGAMSVGSGYHETFSGICFDSFKMPWPSTWIGDKNIDEKEQNALAEYEQCLEKHGQSVAAIILEPMIQGAGGMRMIRPQFLQKVYDLAKQNGILVIFDEVMTGFFRTGKLFASMMLDPVTVNGSTVTLAPDIMCISKGLTGGFLPMSLTITSNEVFEAFLGDSMKQAFVHGHSYTANPLGCAAALASFDILFADDTQNNIRKIENTHKHWAEKLVNNDLLEEVRHLGTISAFSVKKYQEKRDRHVRQMLEAGFMIRPLGNVIYFMPPYSTTADQLNEAYEKCLSLLG
ncbi:adenosylmethionine--8-amino-7-oxononanoate aminotransferase BioA [Alphaproteobacteria bacterium]|nr:adenosylmethionine--8-amino-7-oxononanoate aminotransferase BioA [Alphaproteobacteria bacterium]